jgi:hypothetical protein
MLPAEPEELLAAELDDELCDAALLLSVRPWKD